MDAIANLATPTPMDATGNLANLANLATPVEGATPMDAIANLATLT